MRRRRELACSSGTEPGWGGGRCVRYVGMRWGGQLKVGGGNERKGVSGRNADEDAKAGRRRGSGAARQRQQGGQGQTTRREQRESSSAGLVVVGSPQTGFSRRCASIREPWFGPVPAGGARPRGASGWASGHSAERSDNADGRSCWRAPRPPGQTLRALAGAEHWGGEHPQTAQARLGSVRGAASPEWAVTAA